tara:strand:- start:8556 stop:8792 length:237 start_codon:yes stop_codon:yes gene_type:complete
MSIPGEYVLWCRRTSDPEAVWTQMSYSAGSYDRAEDLVEHYEEKWGNHYEYEIHTAGRWGSRPESGMLSPAIGFGSFD